jgi:CTP:molybdopterin cytidylyltransferase MocA
VLAAGAGRRFGGTKQLADLDGRPLLQHAIDAANAETGSIG